MQALAAVPWTGLTLQAGQHYLGGAQVLQRLPMVLQRLPMVLQRGWKRAMQAPAAPPRTLSNLRAGQRNPGIARLHWVLGPLHRVLQACCWRAGGLGCWGAGEQREGDASAVSGPTDLDSHVLSDSGSSVAGSMPAASNGVNSAPANERRRRSPRKLA